MRLACRNLPNHGHQHGQRRCFGGCWSHLRGARGMAGRGAALPVASHRRFFPQLLRISVEKNKPNPRSVEDHALHRFHVRRHWNFRQERGRSNNPGRGIRHLQRVHGLMNCPFWTKLRDHGRCSLGLYGGRPSRGTCERCISRGENNEEFARNLFERQKTSHPQNTPRISGCCDRADQD